MRFCLLLCRFLPAVQANVRSYLQQYSDWQHAHQQSTMPAPAPATAHQPTSAGGLVGTTHNSTTHSLEASQPMPGYPPTITRTPFSTITAGLPSVTVQSKSAAGRQPPSKIVAAAAGDQENAAAVVPVGGGASSLFGPQQSRLHSGSLSGAMSPMRMR